MPNVFQGQGIDGNLEATVQLASQGIHSPSDLMRLSEAMKRTDPEQVFRRVCQMKGADPDAVLEQARMLVSMSGFNGMRKP